jgi:hypothetical protein
VGSADNIPPDFPDLFGLISAHSSTGSVSASEGSGVADAGVGSAVSIPALGLRVGRISSHVDVHGGSTGATSAVVTTLHDVDLGTPSFPGMSAPQSPPGTSLLHIGTLVLTATTQRQSDAAKATSRSTLEASGVTVAGQAARLDQNGLSMPGPQTPLTDAANRLISSLYSSQCTPAAPVGVPQLGSLTSVPTLRIGPPTLRNAVTHNGNQAAVSMTGPTLCVATTAPIPGNGGVAATPTIYTITLGDVTSSAYGVSLPPDTTSFQLSPALPETGVGLGGSTLGPDTGGTGAATTGTGAGTAPPASQPSHAAPRSLLATLTGGILSRRVVVTLAILVEAALLGTLWSSWLLARSARRRATAAADSPTTRMDLV